MADLGQMPDLSCRTAVVLLRPKSPGNVGSVARAMKNMGFSRLILADPMTYEDPGYFEAEARRMAWQAADLLERRQVEPDLGAALAPFTLIVGTSSSPLDGARVVSPAEAASEIVRHLVPAPCASAALLFGQEDIGLTREHLARCHLIGRIPSAPAYPSLNLAQAALIFLYEMRLALLGRPQAAGPPDPDSDTPATHARLEAFYGRFEEVLAEIGFLQGTARSHMMRELRRIFNRALLTSRELAIFEGIARQTLWASRRRG